MTAIAIVGTSLGFIVAADGRCTLEEAFRPRATPAQLARESEHMQKIFPAKVNGGELAYAFTGTIANDDSGIDLLRESEKQQLLLSKKSFDDARRYINKFSEGLDAAINRYKHFPKLAPRLEGPGWDILNAFFVGYFKRKPCFYRAQFYHLCGVIAEYEVTPYAGAILSGSQVVRRSMYNDDGTAVADSPFAQYVMPIRTSSLDDAATYAAGYVEACCSPLAAELDPKMGRMTGGHVHVAQVTADGFAWRVPPKANPVALSG